MNFDKKDLMDFMNLFGDSPYTSITIRQVYEALEIELYGEVYGPGGELIGITATLTPKLGSIWLWPARLDTMMYSPLLGIWEEILPQSGFTASDVFDQGKIGDMIKRTIEEMGSNL